jgi:hypothetical protein
MATYMKRYAASYCADKSLPDGSRTTRHGVMLTKAANEYEALGMFVESARARCPSDEGFTTPDVVVAEVK